MWTGKTEQTGQIRTDILICVQTVCKVHQQATNVAASKERVNSRSAGVKFLRTENHMQTKWSRIRLLLEEQSDQKLFVFFLAKYLLITRMDQSKSATGRFHFRNSALGKLIFTLSSDHLFHNAGDSLVTLTLVPNRCDTAFCKAHRLNICDHDFNVCHSLWFIVNKLG